MLRYFTKRCILVLFISSFAFLSSSFALNPFTKDIGASFSAYKFELTYPLYGVGTENNIGGWNGTSWNNLGYLGNWSIDWITWVR